MNIRGSWCVVTGGASGLGRASAERLVELGGNVLVIDLPGSPGEALALELGASCRFAPADITSAEQMSLALDSCGDWGPLRAVVHCAGRGGPVRILDREGQPGSLEQFSEIVRINLVGTFNVLRLAAARMAQSDPIDGERGVVVLTASIAAWDGQIGQIPYASSKAGIVGMTLVAARDLAARLIRVATIAPGVFDTPMLARVSDDVRAALAANVPHPARLGRPSEFGRLAADIIQNPMINGETIRLDGALRMAPR